MSGFTIRGLTFEPPLQPTSMLVVMKMRCMMCKVAFAEGDVWAPCPGHPINATELAKRDRGEPFQARSNPIHLDCVVSKIMAETLWPTTSSDCNKYWIVKVGEA